MKKLLIIVSFLLVGCSSEFGKLPPEEKNFGYDFTCHTLQQCETIAENKKNIEKLKLEMLNMSFEKYLDRANSDCGDYLNTNNEYCACTDKKRRETATEKTKELFIEDRVILGFEGYLKYEEWKESERYKKFKEYEKTLADACKEHTKPYDPGY